MHLISTSIANERLSQFIDEALKPHLPYSLPLLRRCQYHRNQQDHDSRAEIWLVSASTQQSEHVGLQNGRYDSLNKPSAEPWLAVHIDLTNAGQTQVWTFGSWEASFAISSDPISAIRQASAFQLYQQLFDTMLEHLRVAHVPKLPREPPQAWLTLKETGKIVSLPFSRSKVLFGTLAECLWPFLDDVGKMVGQRGISREDRGYLKYVLTAKASSLAATQAPPPLHFGPMQRDHLQTVLDRTDIPRSIETLLSLHNVALFNEHNVPIAWGLLGKDASLSSLHTEPEYRRRGLAETVSKKLLADQTNLFVDSKEPDSVDYDVYCHADVHTRNIASQKVMEKLGSKVLWRVGWIEVELGESSESV